MNSFPSRRFTLLIFFIAASANGFQKSAQPELPNFDRRQPQEQAALHKKHAQAEAHLRKDLPMVQVEFDEIVGSPKLISSPDGFLSGKKASGRGISPDTAADFPANEPHRATKAFLQEHSELFGHGPQVLVSAKIKRDFVSAHNGMRTVVWEQRLNDIPVFESLLISHTTKNEELVNISSHFLPDAAQAVKNGARNPLERGGSPGISAEAAIAIAAGNVGEKVGAADIASLEAAAPNAEKRQKFKVTQLNGEAEASLVWLPMNAKSLRLCWEIVLTSRTRGEMFRVLVDAQTGEVLVRRCLTNYISDASYRVYTSDSPTPFSPGHSTPLATQPSAVPRVLITTKAFNTNASPQGWIPDGLNQTSGNNVDSHLDRNNDNLADTPRPQGSPFRVFDFPMNLKEQPGNYTNASVVQLFFLCNWYHDKLYELGFTEAAGNFQVNNFGRGGLGNDPVQADAQDGGGFNNANFSTPADGSSGRMQMYVFSGPTPQRDGDFDAEIVFHEYTHGLSNRRVGGGVGISALQTAGMGEGWGDFYGLCLLSQQGDDVNGNYAMGGYATHQMYGLQENYYFGIRRYPYSTDMTKNPLTFKDIDPNQANEHFGIPKNQVVGGGGPAAVHNQGEVWCSALWEVRAQLISKHGFAIGNQLALQLVTDGMNLSPANPNFLQARDAIIQADQVNSGGANRNEIWAGFAKRGMGFFASSPPSYSTTGVVESFTLPDDLRISPQTPFIATGPAGGLFVPGSQIFTLTNFGTNTINWSAGASAPWLSLSSSNGMLVPGGPSATVTVNLNSTANLLPTGIYNAAVYFTNVTSGISQQRSVGLYIGQQDYFTEIFEGDADLDNQTFTFTPDGSVNFYSVCRQPASGFPTDPAGGTIASLTDDSYHTVILSGTNQVRIYGGSHNFFFIGSNGYITFGLGDNRPFPLPQIHFDRPRISAFLADLFPSVGQVTWKQMSNRVAVTFSNVREYLVANTNSFQIEMFFDGRIRLTYLRMDAAIGLAGLSGGSGIPANFVERDFSAYDNCSARLLINLPAGATEGNGVLIGQGKVSTLSPVSSNLTVNLVSSDTTELIVPASVVIASGQTNATFDLTIVDDGHLDGTQRPALSASAAGFSGATRSMAVFDNDPATLVVNVPASAIEGSSNAIGTVSLNPPPADNVTVTLSSSNVTLVEVPSFVLIPAGQTSAVFSIHLPNNSQIDGNRSVALSAHVDGWVDGVDSITAIDDENTNLTVTLYREQIREGEIADYVGFILISGTLPTNLSVTLTSGDPAQLAVSSPVSIPAGSTFELFHLTSVDNALLDGNRVLQVNAAAPGFSNGSNSITILDNEIPLLPTDFKPVDSTTNNHVNVDLEWSSLENNPAIIYDVYFGTNATPGPAEFLGSTSNLFWELPTLTPFTTYYWQIVARTVGQTNSPILQFGTRAEVASIGDVSVLEGNSGTTNAVFTVTLSDPSPQPVTLQFETSSSSAFGDDYISTNGILTFGAGQTNKTFSVVVKGDTASEFDELFFVHIFSPDESVLIPFLGAGTSVASCTIVNDDSTLAPNYYLLAEESCVPGNGIIDPGEAVTVSFSIWNMNGPITNLTVALQETSAVISPSAPINYGFFDAGFQVLFAFSFLANAECGSNITATLLLTDGGIPLGTVDFALPIGILAPLKTTNTFSVPGALALPDSGPAFPYPSSNLVSGITGIVTKVTVTLSNITHTFPEDINVMLVDPNDQACVLMANFGGGFDVTNVTMTFDSEAPFPPYGSQLVSGTYSPNYFAPVPVFPPPAPSNYFTSLFPFNDTNPNGTWRLFVFDDSAEDSGAIAGGWTLNIESVVGTNCVSCGSLPVSPLLQVTPGPGPNITLSWMATFGKTNRVQFKDDLSQPQWSNVVPDVVATNSTFTLIVPPSSTQRFYRLLVFP